MPPQDPRDRGLELWIFAAPGIVLWLVLVGEPRFLAFARSCLGRGHTAWAPIVIGTLLLNLFVIALWISAMIRNLQQTRAYSLSLMRWIKTIDDEALSRLPDGLPKDRWMTGLIGHERSRRKAERWLETTSRLEERGTTSGS